MSDKLLFHEFPPISLEEWEEKIITDLKGADYDKKLLWKTEEGFSVKPYYRKEDLIETAASSLPGDFPFLRAYHTKGNEWKVIQQIDSKSLEEANQFANLSVKRGVQGISLNADQVDSQKDLAILLKDIKLTETVLQFHSSASYSVLADLLRKELNRQNIDATKLKGSFNFDSFGYYLLNGEFYNSHEDNMNELVCLLVLMKKDLPEMRLINVNAQHFSNAGANAVQELAYALAASVEYIHQLTEKGSSIEDILPRMRLTLSIGPSYFMEIAKFRAARMLWANIAAQFTEKKELQKTCIHGVSSLYNKTIYDLHNNMLRNTTEAMSAAIGGADEISILPHDHILGKETEFGDRIARNVQLLLKEESHLDKVADPSGGSYYIENLTKSLAEHAWNCFLDIENQGGYLKVMTNASIKIEIEKTNTKREKLIASRRKIYVGVNNYPNTKESLNNPELFLNKKQVGDNALKMIRGAERFEYLRMRTDIHVNNNNTRPKVVLLQFGHPAISNARAIFATNFFGISGYNIEAFLFDNNEGLLKIVEEEKAAIFVFCSSDEEYINSGIEYIRSVKAIADKTLLIVAGSPGDNESILRDAGVQEFIHLRSNALEVLQKFHELLSIQ